MPLESEIFKLTEWSIRVWFSLMEEFHQIGGWAIIKVRLTWSIQEYTIYYPVVLILGYGVILLDSNKYSYKLGMIFAEGEL